MQKYPIYEKFVEWKEEILVHRYLLLISLVFLFIGGILDSASGNFVTKINGAIVPDLILDNVTPINLEYIFTYGYLFSTFLLFLYPLFFKVKKLHIVINQFSLLIMVRGFFMIFTHLKTPIDAVVVNFPWLFSHLNYQNDLFFSGHVAVTFLGFLIFEEKIRYFFLISSIIFGITVLLMHIHYSIDVLSAFFITYGVYKIGNWLLQKLHKSLDYI